MKTQENQNHRSARNETPRYRAATVRESVPLFFNHEPIVIKTLVAHALLRAAFTLL